MKKAKKVLTLVCCAVLLVCISVGATIAYLTSTTEVVTNTFTVGDIEITLDEAKVVKDGNDDYVADGDTRIEASSKEVEQSYKLHPGINVLKDPTIRLDEDSENCYIVAKIVVSVDDKSTTVEAEKNTIEDLRNLLGYEGSNGLIGFAGIVTGGAMSEEVTQGAESVADSTIYYENDNVYLTQTVKGDENIFYVYYKTENVLAEGRQLNYTVFTNIVIPDDYDGEDMAKLAGLNIDVTGYAVQADGFKGVVDAFKAAFEEEYNVAKLPVEQ